MKARFLVAAWVLGVSFPQAALAQKRPLTPGDIYNLKTVGDPQRSPDGTWVAYVVSRAMKDSDKNDADIWMARWDGTQNIQLTSDPDSETRPRWSPDNKYLSFVSSRQGAKGGQLWLMNREGGEAVKVTDLKGGISDYAWAPDAKRIVLVVEVPDPRDQQSDDATGDKKKTPPPIVIDRYHFKEDVAGYLRNEHTHLYLFDVDSRKAEILTPGNFDEASPAWSPDGSRIAFISKRAAGDLDRTNNTDIWLMDAKPGATARPLTTTPVPESGPLAWSPDGKQIACVQGDDIKYLEYTEDKLVVVPVEGGQPRVLAASLDRPVRAPVWAADGASIVVTVSDDRSQYPVRVPLSGGAPQRLLTGQLEVSSVSAGRPDGSYAVLSSSDTEPPEVFALEAGKLRRLSHQNDEWLSHLLLGATEAFASTSKDGTEVHGLITKPASFRPGEKYPTLLRIHGGPNGQDGHTFDFERQLFAGNGYVVVQVNYRGSSGRGSAYQKAIFADWGDKEVLDLLGAMDSVEKLPYVDAARLGVGGWSYGCILTDYTIASDPRFKAATCGAGTGSPITLYGVDEYINQYDNELGPPWKTPDVWMKLSYPLFHADRIHTPTLFMGGDRDYNVPLVAGEQMYQALKSLGVDSELVIYPSQFHGITIPSYKVDRLQRYLDWYAKYLKPEAEAPGSRRR